MIQIMLFIGIKNNTLLSVLVWFYVRSLKKLTSKKIELLSFQLVFFMESKQNQSESKIDFLLLCVWCMWTKRVTVSSAGLFFYPVNISQGNRDEKGRKNEGWGWGTKKREVTEKKNEERERERLISEES